VRPLPIQRGRFYTMKSAHPGNLAIPDDRDLFAQDAGPIGDGRVLATFVEGEPVFEDDDFRG